MCVSVQSVRISMFVKVTSVLCLIDIKVASMQDTELVTGQLVKTQQLPNTDEEEEASLYR